jgi:hypothetical protein
MIVRTEGLRQIKAALAEADRDTKRLANKELREIAEPVARSAEVLVIEDVPTIGDEWYKMRTGAVRTGVYIAPKSRGTRIRSRQRPNLRSKLLKPMEESVSYHEPETIRRFDGVLDDVAREFNRGGPV